MFLELVLSFHLSFCRCAAAYAANLETRKNQLSRDFCPTRDRLECGHVNAALLARQPHPYLQSRGIPYHPLKVGHQQFAHFSNRARKAYNFLITASCAKWSHHIGLGDYQDMCWGLWCDIFECQGVFSFQNSFVGDLSVGFCENVLIVVAVAHLNLI